MSSAAEWWRSARAIERLIQSDDERGAVMVRRELEREISRAPTAASCADPDLFALLIETATRWSRRFDPTERARLSGAALSLAAAVMRIPAEAELARRAEAERRADPKTIAAEGGG